MMRVKKGFTLIELLVVISIIAMLLAVMMPALSRAREQARMLVCSTNLKTLVLGASLWSADNRDFAIAGSWWRDARTVRDDGTIEDRSRTSILPYIDASRTKKKDSLVCPSASGVRFENPGLGYDTSDQETMFTYASNGYMTYNIGRVSPGVIDVPGGGGTPTYGGGELDDLYGPDNIFWNERGITRVSTIRNPSRIAYFIDHEYYFIGHWFFDPTIPIHEFATQWQFQTRWHQRRGTGDQYGYGKGMIGWVDGHVTREPEDFTEIRPPNSARRRDRRWTAYYMGPGYN